MTILLSIGLVYIMKEFVIDSILIVKVFGYEINYLFAIVFVTFLVSIINFTMSKLFVFTTELDKHRQST